MFAESYSLDASLSDYAALPAGLDRHVVDVRPNGEIRPGLEANLQFRGLGELNIGILATRDALSVLAHPRRDFISLSCVSAGRVIGRSREGKPIASQTSFCVETFSSPWQLDFLPESRILTSYLDPGAVARHVRVMSGDEPRSAIVFQDVVPGSPADLGMQFVMGTLMNALSGEGAGVLAQAPLAQASLKDMILNALIELCPSNIRPPRFARVSERVAVRRAHEYMEANMGRPIRVADIAEASGVPLRTLQMSFRARTGRSLVEHLRTLRLERARADLRSEAWLPRVSEVAYRWGFSNLSDFSRRYLEAFGEHPRDTLHRREW